MRVLRWGSKPCPKGLWLCIALSNLIVEYSSDVHIATYSICSAYLQKEWFIYLVHKWLKYLRLDLRIAYIFGYLLIMRTFESLSLFLLLSNLFSYWRALINRYCTFMCLLYSPRSGARWTVHLLPRLVWSRLHRLRDDQWSVAVPQAEGTSQTRGSWSTGLRRERGVLEQVPRCSARFHRTGIHFFFFFLILGISPF